MSEIEKMYENAGVEKCNSTLKDIISDICLKECEEETYKCKDCEHFEYPPFTAEKLINLVMFLINKGDFDIKKGSVDITFESFTSCIAGLINNLWQDLTEEERKQIADILKG